MVKIRLRRVGAKDQPSYRVVVADQRSPRDGRFIENIGHYNPRTEPETVVIDAERAGYWLSVGAQPTDGTERLLKKVGAYEMLAKYRSGELVPSQKGAQQEAARPTTFGAVAETLEHTLEGARDTLGLAVEVVSERARTAAETLVDAARSAVETVTGRHTEEPKG
jgi:small subunit ribosomal protein S16